MDQFRGITARIAGSLISFSRYIRYILFLPFTPLLEKLAKRATLRYLDIEIDGNKPTDVIVKNKRVYAYILAYGELGVGETFLFGWWDARSNFGGLIKKFLSNKRVQSSFQYYKYTPTYWESIFYWNFLNLQKSTRGALVPCKLQYNLSADYYGLFLDDNLVYSTAHYITGDESLDQAQFQKCEVVATELELKAGMTLLDIGCGFGCLSKYLADRHNVDVVGVTNSTGMAEDARNRCKGSRVEIRICDWRDIKGTYDRISIIEMMEHVGGNNWKEFFNKLDSLLNPGGKVFIQVNTLEAGMMLTQDFMNQYLFGAVQFPQIKQVVAYSSNVLELIKVWNCKMDAVRFCVAMLQKFELNYDKIVAMVGPDVTKAMWYIWLGGQWLYASGHLCIYRVVLNKRDGIGEVCDGIELRK